MKCIFQAISIVDLDFQVRQESEENFRRENEAVEQVKLTVKVIFEIKNTKMKMTNNFDNSF
jgi:hypothetical protein